MPRYFSKVFALIALALLLFLIVLSFNRVVGGFNTFLVREHLIHWAEQEDNPGNDDLLKVEGFYQTAIEATPHNPDLLQLGGRLAEWQAYLAEEGSELKKEYFAEAINRYRLSIKQRQTWPYAWYDLAMVKARASIFDDEYQAALRTAIELGPNERDIQLGVIQTGLLTWQQLDDQTKDSVLKTIHVVLKRDPKLLYRAASDHDQVELLCSLVSGDAWLDAKCA